MPELPEVETTLRAIEKFQSLKIHEVKIYNRNLRWKISKDFESLTIGQTVESLKRRAKYLIFHLSNGQNIILHLGMSGSLRIAKNNENFFIKHDHVELIFDDERIIYNDPRRFGYIDLFQKKELKKYYCLRVLQLFLAKHLKPPRLGILLEERLQPCTSLQLETSCLCLLHFLCRQPLKYLNFQIQLSLYLDVQRNQ